MSSACVCHTEEWCFYCNMYTPLEARYNIALAALEWMDDRKKAMMPRPEMARIAKKALDVIRVLEEEEHHEGEHKSKQHIQSSQTEQIRSEENDR